MAGVVSDGALFAPSRIAGVGLLTPPFHEDRRGSFTKPFSPALLQAAGVEFDLAEVYWSRSVAGTIRGLHFQLPPTAVAKIVFATSGHVTDAVVDLRRDSPTYGEHATFDLTPSSGAVLVPVGCAHGFEALEESVLCYLQDRSFDPATDTGVRWDSAGIAWSSEAPVLSDRDTGFPCLADFDSPFTVERA